MVTRHTGEVGDRNLFLFKTLPVNLLKEFMLHDLFDSPGTQALAGVFVEEGVNEVSHLLRECAGV